MINKEEILEIIKKHKKSEVPGYVSPASSSIIVINGLHAKDAYQLKDTTVELFNCIFNPFTEDVLKDNEKFEQFYLEYKDLFDDKEISNELSSSKYFPTNNVNDSAELLSALINIFSTIYNSMKLDSDDKLLLYHEVERVLRLFLSDEQDKYCDAVKIGLLTEGFNVCIKFSDFLIKSQYANETSLKHYLIYETSENITENLDLILELFEKFNVGVLSQSILFSKLLKTQEVLKKILNTKFVILKSQAYELVLYDNKELMDVLFAEENNVLNIKNSKKFDKITALMHSSLLKDNLFIKLKIS